MPGFALSKLLPLNMKERISVSPLFSVLLLSCMAFVSQTLFRVPLPSIGPLILVIAAASTIYCLGDCMSLGDGKWILQVFIAAILFRVILINTMTIGAPRDFINYSDYFDHGLEFLDSEWNYTGYRTPLMSLQYGLVMAIFGNEFWIVQIAAGVINVLLLLPSALIIEKFFGGRINDLALPLLAINPSIIDQSLRMWPKSFTAYFCLVFLYSLIRMADVRGARKRATNHLILAVSAALAILSHYYALFFFLPWVVVYLLFVGRISFRYSLASFIVFVIVLSPWIYFTHVYGSPASGFLKMPLAINGIDDDEIVFFREHSFGELLSDVVRQPAKFVAIRIVNTVNYHAPVLFSIMSVKALDEAAAESIFGPTIHWMDWTGHYSSCIQGQLTLVISIFALLGLWHLMREKFDQFLLIILPTFVLIFYFGHILFFRFGYYFWWSPLIPILVGLGLEEAIVRRKVPSYLLVVPAVIETAIYLYFLHLIIP